MAILDAIDLNEEQGAGCSSSGSSSSLPLADWYEVKKAGEKELATPPTLPADLLLTLRQLQNCPLCAQDYPKLRISEVGKVEDVSKRRQKRKSLRPRTVSGPAKMNHLTLCSFRVGASESIVVELVQREQILLDKKRRLAFQEEQQEQDAWRTVTGEAPPRTQIQTGVLRQRQQGKHDYYIERYVKQSMAQQRGGQTLGRGKGKSSDQGKNDGKATTSKKSKAAPSKARHRTGSRGGFDRATATVEAPVRRSAVVKEQCRLFFGSENGTRNARGGKADGEDEVYDWRDTTSLLPFERITPSQMFSDCPRGLGFGACRIDSLHISPGRRRSSSYAETESRLSMGRLLAQGIVDQVMARERGDMR